jgi:PIN domain nuclease of toxin-antitoxin system
MIVLDTHAWVWWHSEPGKLSRRAHEAIDHADRIIVCTISCWELAMLVTRGRMRLDRDLRAWVGQALARERCVSAQLTEDLAIAAGFLEGFAGDPADRIIYATAAAVDAKLVTKDRALRAYDRRRAVW